MRVEVTNQIRGVLKTFGIVLSRRTGEPFEQLVEEACGDRDDMLSGKHARSCAALPSERIALLILGTTASDAMLWRALVSTTKRTLKPARAKLSVS